MGRKTMKWLTYVLVVSMAVLAPRAVQAQENTNEKVAEYKAPEIGTRLEYVGWTCTVEEVEGLRTLCRLEDGSAITLVGWLEIDGDLPDSGYFQDRLFFYFDGTQKVYTEQTGFNQTELSKIEAIWPLKVGNKTRYRVRVFAGMQFDVRASVEAIEQLDLGGQKIETFVIKLDSRLRGDSSQQNFLRRLWYSPELAVIVKEEFEWTQGPRRGRRFDSDLLSARLPDGTPTFAFAPKPGGDAKQD